MARYAIEETTLTALGDAVRSKVGETKKVVVPLEAEDVSFSWDWDNPEDQEKILNGTLNGSIYSYKKIFKINSAKKYTVNYRAHSNTSNGYFQISFFNDGTMTEVKKLLFNKNDTDYIDSYTCACDYFEITIYKSKNYTDEGKKSNIYITITAYDIDENEITTKEADVKNTMTPTQMVEKINELDSVPDEALTITGSCDYRFAYNGWNWFINKYGDKIQTKDITNCSFMFNNSSKIERIPFEINCKPTATIYCSNLFSACSNLKEIPKMSNVKMYEAASLFAGCYNLRNLPEDIEHWFD